MTLTYVNRLWDLLNISVSASIKLGEIILFLHEFFSSLCTGLRIAVVIV